MFNASRKNVNYLLLFLMMIIPYPGLIKGQEQTEPVVYDVLIVGGGVAGTYCGWRLSESENNNHKSLPKKLHLMESSNRIGGRLFSISLPELPGIYAELGGMRVIPSQEHVFSLLKHLGFKPEVFNSDGTENSIYVRRVRLKKEDIELGSSKVPYNLKEEERGKTAHELMLMGIYKAFPEIKMMQHAQLQEYLKTAVYKGTPLWKIGFWNLLMSELSIEAYHLIIDAGGYYTGVSNWNAYDAIVSYSKYMREVIFYKVKEGLDALPKKLAAEFEKNGGTISLNATVTSLLRERLGNDEMIKIIFLEGSQYKSCYAKHVILALPKRSIELLNQNSFFFSYQELIADLKRVTPENASKVFLWYDDAWWLKLGFTNGPSRTDLPVRQCYYFGSLENKLNKTTKGLLMASYSDGVSVDFWEGYFKESAFDRVKENFEDMDSFIKSHRLPDTMLKELTNQLSLIHGYDVPGATATVFKNWSEDPYGAGWHYWNPHNQSWVVMPRIRHPIKDVNLYICGEAYSACQGWIEGALNTAERVLEENFDLHRPSWINPNYDFGP